ISLGTTNQAQLRERGRKKDAYFVRKYNTYHRHVSNYNRAYTPEEPIPDPTLEQLKMYSITDQFWDGSGLSHPDEPWAINDDVKTGIQAFLTKRSALEEIHRIGREVRQLIMWALDYQARVNDTQPAPQDPDHVSQIVELKSLHHQLMKKSNRLWRRWDPDLEDLLRWTAAYVEGSNELDKLLKTQWVSMMEGCGRQWDAVVGKSIISAEDENDHDPHVQILG
ncbi:hypothetical protein DFH28DRAFT_902317, partial [Melampsora americana]